MTHPALSGSRTPGPESPPDRGNRSPRNHTSRLAYRQLPRRAAPRTAARSGARVRGGGGWGAPRAPALSHGRGKVVRSSGTGRWSNPPLAMTCVIPSERGFADRLGKSRKRFMGSITLLAPEHGLESVADARCWQRDHSTRLVPRAHVRHDYLGPRCAEAVAQRSRGPLPRTIEHLAGAGRGSDPGQARPSPRGLPGSIAGRAMRAVIHD